MRKQNWYLSILMVTLTLSLGACGGSKKKTPAPNNYGYNGYSNLGKCGNGVNYQSMQTAPMRVTGTIGNGATITLDLIENGSGTFQAVGQINIASVESLYGYTNQGNTPFTACVESQGAISFSSGSVYSDVSGILRGSGVTVEFGVAAWGGVTTYVRTESVNNHELVGNIWISLPSLGRPEETHFLMQTP